MVLRALLAMCCLLTAGFSTNGSPLTSVTPCTKQEAAARICAYVSESALVISVEESKRQQPAGSSDGTRPKTPQELYLEQCQPNCRDLYVATVIRATDFESFRPRKPIALSEPVSWAAVGLPANFYAEIEPHTIEGTLLGRPAVARFTPASYRWNFGDGHSLTTRGKGSQWKTQSLKEFSDTATSHTFDRPGDYSVTLTVNYSIEYYYEENADGGWEEFIGYLPIASEPIPMHVASVKTVLVSKTCLQNPTGPGC
ncbi:hypothetical protein DF220_02965 [Salinibacterium hongtaonis]|uniref:PKD domain-containing protein n=1 Tax=Homoserinimonas hongtaonis TaxID=2079791 RepID=A0A2U1SZ83_9MICO|nr:hypothetical protein DF220_02965 [Salinibacterium hongtaonis]